MRQWPGRRDDLSVTSDDGLFTAKNLSYKVSGELRRRPGLSGRLERGGDLLAEWADKAGQQYLVLKFSSGVMDTLRLSDATVTAVQTGLNVVNRGCFARSNGRLYFVNDFDPMRRISDGDQAMELAGIFAPTSAIGTPSTATGLCTAGTHGMRYRYFDSKSLYLSDPSDQTDITLTGPSALTFSIFTSGTTIIRSTDPKVDQIIIELTDAGSSTFYRAATVNQTVTGATVSLSDISLRQQVTASRDGDFNHQPPPLTYSLTEHRGRLFALGQSPFTVTGVSVISASLIVAVSGSTLLSSGWQGRLVRLGTDTKSYRIAAMSGQTVAILSETYSGTTRVVTGAVFYSATPDMLYWSRAGFPESWNTVNFARRVLQNTADTPSGLCSHHEVLYLFGQRTMRMLDYAGDPASAQLVQIPTEMGLWNQRCLIEANGRIYGWGRSGVWTVNGLIPQHLSKPIDLHIDGSDSSSSDNYDVSHFEAFHGCYDPRERCLMWFYATAAEDYPRHAIVMDVDSGNWSITTFKQGITASTILMGGASNPTRMLVSDDFGYSWYLEPDAFDGVPAILSGGVLTVASTGATTTSVPVVESLPTDIATFGPLAGAPVVYSGQETRVDSNDATSIALFPALSAAPAIGTEIFVGQIDFAIRTKWTVYDGWKNKKRPQYLMLAIVPGTSAGKLTVKVYLDYATNPFVYTKGASDTDLDGVTITNNSSSVTVDLDGGSGDGVAFVPLPYNWHRSISVEITSTRPVNLLRFVDYDWIFKDPMSTTPVEDE